MATADQYAEWIVNNADKKGTPDFEIVAQAYKQAKAEESAPAAAPERSIGQQALRQVGLTARYGLESLGNTAQFWSEPFRKAQEFITGKPVVGGGQLASNLADTIGLPSPETKQERIVGDVTRGIGSIASGGGAGQILQKTGTKFAQGVGNALNADPLKQAAAATGAGALGGSVRENGGSALEELGASILGSFAGLAGASAVGSVADKARAVANAFMRPQQIDQQLEIVLGKSGIDYSQVSDSVKSALRKDLKDALLTGKQLDPSALARLTDFRSTGLTPTRGMLTLDPIQVTKEQNLSRIAANSADPALHRLPQMINNNNAKLIQNLNNLGAGEGSVNAAGDAVTAAISGRQSALRSAENAAWNLAKTSPGYRQPISAGVLSDINSALDAEGMMPFMNPTISKYMGAFQSGEPFTPQAYRNLQSMLAREVSKGGNEGAAAGIARRVLENSDLRPTGFANSGGLPVTSSMAAGMRAADNAAEDAISAVNRARQATRQAYAYEDSTPLVRSVLSEGASSDPQRIAQRYVINGTRREAEDLARQVGPQGRQAIKSALLAHLKGEALNNARDEVGKFSQSAFNKALSALDDSGKLDLFFTPQEVSALKANGRAASYMMFQPAGSAVNNSNSGAMLAAKAADALGIIPIIGTAGPAIKNIAVGMSSRSALNAPKSVIVDDSQTLLPLALGANAGLLAAPPR